MITRFNWNAAVDTLAEKTNCEPINFRCKVKLAYMIQLAIWDAEDWAMLRQYEVFKIG